ncbi:MAG: endonuclease, partial [Candidatus Onthovivens sp.]|nr:endonuclease [Bacilli bacterium]
SLLGCLSLSSCNINNNNNNNDNSENNGGNENNPGDDNNDNKPTEGDNTSTQKGDGTKEKPYSCKEALEIINNLPNTDATSEFYYVKGVIESIDEVSTSYGNASFIINSDNTSITAFRVYFLGNKKFTSADQIKVGDNVILYSHLQNYQGKKPELYQGYIYSLNDKTSIENNNTGNDNENNNENNGSNSGSGEIGGGDFGTYYSSINSTMTGGMNGTLRAALTTLCKPKAEISYSSGLSSFLQEADEDPSNSSNMIYFYTRESKPKKASGEWNREHVWPQSLSGGLYGKNGGGCDALHIRPTYVDTNSTRGNLKFGDCPNGTVKTYNGIEFAKTKGGYFEPLDSIKGDCARIVFYMWTVYFAERNTPITNVAESIKTMIEWHKADPVDACEILRNNKVESSVQKNRNPFVDHPEWVDVIFG